MHIGKDKKPAVWHFLPGAALNALYSEHTYYLNESGRCKQAPGRKRKLSNEQSLV
jgi:hypothetical protein